MKNFSKVILASAVALMSCHVFADKQTTFLGPSVRLTHTDTLYSPCLAYSLAGEVGVKQLRIGGNLGWQAGANQRFKLTGEYIHQKISYHFAFGHTEQWVRQAALGALYQYHFCQAWFDPILDFRIYYSHAPSKNRGLLVVNSPNGQIPSAQFIFPLRRLAGSDAGGFAPGITIRPWCGALLETDLNYDHVHYEKEAFPSENVKGLGGTVRFAQSITTNILIDLSAAVRRPFNRYAVSIDWLNVRTYGQWNIALYGATNIGKRSLPNTWDAGVAANYFIDRTGDSLYEEEIAAKFLNIKGCVLPDNFLTWASDPAVYMPHALLVPDERQ